MWDGNVGITSSLAAADGGGARAIGYAHASEIFGLVGATPGTFLGKSGVDDSSVVARLTLPGDATLDGMVDFNDLVQLAQNYNSTVSDATQNWWFNGDFTYDGVVDFEDPPRPRSTIMNDVCLRKPLARNDDAPSEIPGGRRDGRYADGPLARVLRP